MIVLAAAALLWSAPAGFSQFFLTSLPTRIYYCVLSLGGIALLIAGGWLFFVSKLAQRAVLIGCIAALALAVNQATGLTCNTILCFSAG